MPAAACPRRPRRAGQPARPGRRRPRRGGRRRRGGTRRVAALRAGSPDVEAVGREAGLDPWRVRALVWLLGARAVGRRELLLARRAPAPRGARYGALGGVGRRRHARLRPSPAGAGTPPLDETAGRSPGPALAESFHDLGLRAAVHLAERRLPAALAPALVSTLLAELLVEARPLGWTTAGTRRVGARPAAGAPRRRGGLPAGRGLLEPAPVPGGAR